MKRGRRQQWRQDWRGARRHGGRHSNPGFLFVRLAMIFGLFIILILAGMAMLALLFTRLAGGNDTTAVLVWLSGCGLALLFPMLALVVGARAFRNIANPLAEVMAAADAVAEGDLSVRIPERQRGAFKQLVRSFNRMAEELESAELQRRNLTADVAHELRTPLHIIQGNLEGILDRVYEPSDAHIQATLEETEMLARLVEDLLTLALAESGHLSLESEKVEVGTLLTDVQTSFSGQAEAAGVELRGNGDVATGPIYVRGDAGRLNQVLSNLVANALRHTPAGGEVRLAARADQDSVVLLVTDSGAGIPAEELPFIFDRLWRGDKARTHKAGQGAGLGLAISRQLVRAHGGEIEVQSEVGQGTTFAIRLPADR